MQLDTSYVSYTSTVIPNNQQNIDDPTIDEKPVNESGQEPKTLKTMSLEEIQSYLDRYNIEDETGSRANLLFDIQKFSDKIDSTTYNKITNSILEEKSSSRASMRYDSFPSEEMLNENPEMFHAMLETTLSIKDTTRALIFNLDFKRDFSEFKQNSEKEDESLSEFSNMTFIGFLKNKIDEIEESLKDGTSLAEENRLKDYSILVGNYDKFNEEKNDIKIDILV